MVLTKDSIGSVVVLGVVVAVVSSVCASSVVVSKSVVVVSSSGLVLVSMGDSVVTRVPITVGTIGTEVVVGAGGASSKYQ